MSFYVMDHVTVEPGEDGITVVTARVPSYLVKDVIQLLHTLLHVSRVLYNKTRSQEAIHAARRLRVIP